MDIQGLSASSDVHSVPTSMSCNANRLRALALYKELHRLGRDYPDPSYNFHGKLRQMFEKNKNLTDEEDIQKAFKLGEYIKNETLALYSLRKYRHLKRAYSSAQLTSIR